VYIAEGGTSVYQDEVLQMAKSSTGSFCPVLMLFPTKLGKVDTTEDYQKSVKETFKFSQAVGIAG
jgi:cysteine protease ATG4